MTKGMYYISNIVKNLIFGLCPKLVLKIRKPSGRGSKDIDSYHFDIFNSYFIHLGIKDIEAFLDRKVVAEIGPGDILGTAFYSLVYGAEKVICIDRFPLADINNQHDIFTKLVEYLPLHKKKKGYEVVNSNLEDSIVYLSDISGSFDSVPDFKADLILSNAVLEHVYDLKALFDLLRSISTGTTIMFHGIDLRSHKMHYRNELDFLSIENFLWKIMTCYRGAPNRLRRKDYLRFFEANSIKIEKEITFETFDKQALNDFLSTRSTRFSYRELEPSIIGFICSWEHSNKQRVNSRLFD